MFPMNLFWLPRIAACVERFSDGFCNLLNFACAVVLHMWMSNLLKFKSCVVSRNSCPAILHKSIFGRMASSSTFKFAGIQLSVGESKTSNIQNAKQKITDAANSGAKIVSLPECWNCPYSVDSFGPYSEPATENNHGPSFQMLSQAAKEHSLYLIGGSIPEKDSDGKLYNTSLTFNPEGKLVAKHRKVHLFDVDIPGRITFQESKVLSPGNQLTTFDTEYCKIGVGICYDIRFPEMALIYTRLGCKMICYPGAFNMTTGPAHWELLQRGRALDGQLYVATVSPSRNPDSSYQAWGHSSVVNPWGEVIATTDHQEGIIYANIDLKRADEVRAQIPTSKQKRYDLYDVRAQHS